ncbi:hypothetical protein GCM10011587_03930 [Pyruvatibacter mobilis]|nr:hypothetical protein GCM10011587_03930 [Pyruvatibacter mobilis]
MKKFFVALTLMIPLSGCLSIAATDECAIFRPISYSRSDTSGTVREIAAHNAKWEHFCTTDPSDSGSF